MPSIVTDISGEYESQTELGLEQVVVEDGVVLRWWHTYVLCQEESVLRFSHHALTEDDDEELDDLESGIPLIVEE